MAVNADCPDGGGRRPVGASSSHRGHRGRRPPRRPRRARARRSGRSRRRTVPPGRPGSSRGRPRRWTPRCRPGRGPPGRRRARPRPRSGPPGRDAGPGSRGPGSRWPPRSRGFEQRRPGRRWCRVRRGTGRTGGHTGRAVGPADDGEAAGRRGAHRARPPRRTRPGRPRRSTSSGRGPGRPGSRPAAGRPAAIGLERMMDPGGRVGQRARGPVEGGEARRSPAASSPCAAGCGPGSIGAGSARSVTATRRSRRRPAADGDRQLRQWRRPTDRMRTASRPPMRRRPVRAPWPALARHPGGRSTVSTGRRHGHSDSSQAGGRRLPLRWAGWTRWSWWPTGRWTRRPWAVVRSGPDGPGQRAIGGRRSGRAALPVGVGDQAGHRAGRAGGGRGGDALPRRAGRTPGFDGPPPAGPRLGARSRPGSPDRPARDPPDLLQRRLRGAGRAGAERSGHAVRRLPEPTACSSRWA